MTWVGERAAPWFNMEVSLNGPEGKGVELKNQGPSFSPDHVCKTGAQT